MKSFWDMSRDFSYDEVMLELVLLMLKRVEGRVSTISLSIMRFGTARIPQ
jgi:hypothetical protein